MDERRSQAGIILLVIILLFLQSPDVLRAIENNQSAYYFLQAIDVQHSLENGVDVLYTKSTLSWNDLLPPSKNGCHELWRSRMIAVINPTIARRIAESIQDCPQTDYVQRWRGLLAWQFNQPDDAVSYWANIPIPYLIQWGRWRLLDDERELAKALLQVAENQHHVQALEPAMQAQLYQMLGDLARYEQNHQQAVFYYRQAWKLSDYSYRLAYYLGVSYAAQDDCVQAVWVWETGLRKKPKRAILTLDSSYFIQLGSCHAKLGNRSDAITYLDFAQVLIKQHGLADRQQDWLDRVRQNLE
jgi:tetratricopeptide (TPR) repeat protein